MDQRFPSPARFYFLRLTLITTDGDRVAGIYSFNTKAQATGAPRLSWPPLGGTIIRLTLW